MPPRNAVRQLRAGAAAALFITIIAVAAVSIAKSSNYYSPAAFPLRRLVALSAKLLKHALPMVKLLAVSRRQVGCSGTCAAENCDTIEIRYGKYCGVGWTGCRGEKPCDDLDACCQIHDQCVDQYGMSSIKCHKECKKCIENVKKSGKVGFSNNCTYDRALPTLTECMDLAVLVSQFRT
ncbi:hypothetical protein ACP275_11G057900 [Erythranthe tilingii]